MTIYFFYLFEDEKNSTLSISLKELVIEDFSFGGEKRKNKLVQDNQLGQTNTILINDYLQNQDQ